MVTTMTAVVACALIGPPLTGQDQSIADLIKALASANYSERQKATNDC
jgi:hypothetical protein